MVSRANRAGSTSYDRSYHGTKKINKGGVGGGREGGQDGRWEEGGGGRGKEEEGGGRGSRDKIGGGKAGKKKERE
jgi:hypothetical protein